MIHSFCVIDTEGHPILNEIAIVDMTGQVIYEAFTSEVQRPVNPERTKLLIDILEEVRQLTQGRTMIAHHANHDARVLKQSYESVGLTAPKWKFLCTLKQAQAAFPELDGYRLEDLCHRFELGTDRFLADRAHVAAYDATYTYHLYRHLQLEEHRKRLQKHPNPFSSSRVDSPFQSFIDAADIYADQYQKLKHILADIAQDNNQQSRGVVLIGEPGSGKTHLMMRLAQDIIHSNRILFIRQPTNVHAVFYHVYARVLESLVQPANQDHTSQLDLLLIRSIRSIMSEIPDSDRSQRDWEVIKALEAETLAGLGNNGTKLKRERWLRIEKRVLQWWSIHCSLAGYREQILKGILRFCRYTDPNRREVLRKWLTVGEISDADSEQYGLTAWQDRANQEELSLQAIQIIGDLSTLDQPLIIVFDQLEGLWQSVNQPILVRFGEVLKELFTHVPNALIITTLFPDRWQQFQVQFDGSITERVAQSVLVLERPHSEQLQSIIQSRLKPIEIKAQDIFLPDDLAVILQQPSIRHSLNRAGDYYAFRIKQEPLPIPAKTVSKSSSLPAPELEQRVALMERKLNALYDFVKSIASEQKSPEPPKLAHVVEKIEEIEALSVVDSEPYDSDIQRYLSAQAEALHSLFSKPQIITDEDDAGKLRQICHAFSSIKFLEVSELKLGRKALPVHVLISDKQGQRCVGFLHSESLTSVNSRLINLNQLVSLHAHISFIMIRDQQLREIDSPKAATQLERFKNARMDVGRRTHFEALDLRRRVEFELAYKLVTDIINRDFEMTLQEGLSAFVKLSPNNWIVKLLAKAEISKG